MISKTNVFVLSVYSTDALISPGLRYPGLGLHALEPAGLQRCLYPSPWSTAQAVAYTLQYVQQFSTKLVGCTNVQADVLGLPGTSPRPTGGP